MINNPKVVCFDWLKSQKLDNVRRLLKDQSLRKFLEMKGNIYPDLIRVFYKNLKFEGNNLVSHVKGVDMDFQHDDLPEAHQDAGPSAGAGNEEEKNANHVSF